MKVHSVVLRNFTTHDLTRFDLPAHGIVAITGENGAGKSSIIEGIAWAVWGKTLRGTVPWRGLAPDPACRAHVTTDRVQVSRSRAGAKTALDWSTLDKIGGHPAVQGSGEDEFATTSKAASALHQITGSFDLWKRSHVFSSADAAHFTLATDSERKRLIETFLGNDRFDTALEKCRTDLKASRATLERLVRERDVASAKLDAARLRASETKKQLAAAPDLREPAASAPGRTLAEFDRMLSSTRKELNALRSEVSKADAAGGEQRARAAQVRAILDRLRSDKCPTCTQAIPKEFKQKLQTDAEHASHEAAAARATAEQGTADLADSIEELEDEVQALQRKRNEQSLALQAHAHQWEAWRSSQRQRALMETTLRDAEASIGTLTDELSASEDTVQSTAQDVEELTACEQVLGLKGVRAHILGRSLVGIEAVANVWLGKLAGPDFRLALRPYSELKKGGVDDSISIEVTGVGGGLGYRASSSGERRRIDIALLLALAEVAGASRGEASGTLFFDEALDGLDEPGVEAVAVGLGELARSRTIVIVTHNKTLLARLPAVQRLHVVEGRVTALG